MKPLRDILLKRHQSVEPKLNRMWNETLAPELHSRDVGWRATLRRGRGNITDATERVPPVSLGSKLWQELIWPSRRIWAGLACVWMLLIAWNMASSDEPQRVATRTEPPTGREFQALLEQRRMLAQLIDPLSEPPGKRRPSLPGPRSDRPIGTFAA